MQPLTINASNTAIRDVSFLTLRLLIKSFSVFSRDYRVSLLLQQLETKATKMVKYLQRKFKPKKVFDDNSFSPLESI